MAASTEPSWVKQLASYRRLSGFVVTKDRRADGYSAQQHEWQSYLVTRGEVQIVKLLSAAACEQVQMVYSAQWHAERQINKELQERSAVACGVPR